MLTYSFYDRGNEPLYEYLYNQIKKDITSFKLSADEKLPSKRALAKNLNISIITVENAYSQLIAEGYIYSVPKSGFYVCDISSAKPMSEEKPKRVIKTATDKKKYIADFVNNSMSKDSFPFTVWSKLMREIMSDLSEKLMVRSPSAGVEALRNAIADYLYQFRGMAVEPEQIVVGAGTEYLYGLIIQLLGHEKKYGVEDPGYEKISRIYKSNNVKCEHISLDDNGINIEELEESKSDVLHISPAHHFPTGFVTPISRRYELLSWASKNPDRYIIEDDYDSEFRFLGKPIPPLQSIDVLDKVIYINTFSKSLSSTIRISYMVLPKPLMEKYKKELSFYSCTVSNFDQYTLAKFIDDGYLEKHINRMRNYYRTQRDTLLSCIKKQSAYNKVRISEEHAGLHFLMEIETKLTDEVLKERAAKAGVNIAFLSEYFYDKNKAKSHTVVINYSGLNKESIEKGIDVLFGVIE